MDVVNLVSIPVGVAGILVGRLARYPRLADVWQRVVLGHRIGDVDAKPVDPAVEPETENVIEFGDDIRVLPVPVRLTDVEQVEVPLTIVDALPCRPAEGGGPPIRRGGAARTIGTLAEPEAL